MKNIIAIDYGERYVGLALKKQSINSAYAYKVLDSKSLDVLDEIKQSLIDQAGQMINSSIADPTKNPALAEQLQGQGQEEGCQDR